jgi:hypothetical protein
LSEDAAAHAIARLQDDNAQARTGESQRSRQSCNTCADDDYIRISRHLKYATREETNLVAAV